MKWFLKIADSIDVAPLVAELDAQPELWDRHNRRKTAPGTPHQQMSDIWVRYKDDAENARTGDYANFSDEHFPIWYPAYRALPALKPILFGLMAMTEGEHLGGVLITRIPPGCGIAPHVDRGWHVDFYHKFYVSLRSSPGAKFLCGEDVLEPKPGECWRFDNRNEHSVQNDSDEDRMTLIVCIHTEKYQCLTQ